MSFEFFNTEINGVKIIVPHCFEDERGLYKKNYEKYIFAENGILDDFIECSDIFSKKGVLRGLHYQTKNSQAKLVHVISGILYDVVLDLRKNSSTFGKIHTELLRAEENRALYIPEGMAHGFLSLSEHTVFSYQCSGKYLPAYCGGIRWDDPGLGIKWPLNDFKIERIIATERDKAWPTLSEYISSNKMEEKGT